MEARAAQWLDDPPYDTALLSAIPIERCHVMAEIFAACKGGSVFEVRDWLEEAYDRNMELTMALSLNRLHRVDPDPFTTTPLHVACYQGHVDVVRLLLNRLVAAYPHLDRVGGLAIKGSTLLHAACTRNGPERTDGKIAVVRLLMEFLGHVATGTGRVELLSATPDRAKEAAEFRGAGEEHTPLEIACASGYAEMARALIAGGADVDAVNNEYMGVTPLMLACRSDERGTLAVVKLLLEHGADLTRTGVKGDTPLHFACRSLKPSSSERSEVARLLLARGAAFDLENTKGKTALAYGSRDIFDDEMRLALWRRLKLYASGRPSKYTLSAQHRVAGLPELSHHIGSFLVLRSVDLMLSNRERAAVLHVIAEIDGKASLKTVRRNAEEILGMTSGGLDAKKVGVRHICFKEVWRLDLEGVGPAA